MLVGALSGSELVVTAVLVPNQRGSSDMCEMTNEEEIWECVPSYARNRRSCRSRPGTHRHHAPRNAVGGKRFQWEPSGTQAPRFSSGDMSTAVKCAMGCFMFRDRHCKS